MAIVQDIDLNLIPDSEAVVLKVNQYDDTGRIQAHLYLNDTAYTPTSGATVRIEGTKPDKHGFSYTASISGNTVTADLTTQMTAVAGRTRAQIIVEETSGKTGTFVFWLDVQAAALADDTDVSDTEIPAIVDAARQNAAIASAAAESAAASAESVQGYAGDAEAYAVGKRGGTDVPSSDVAYHNNSKYYAQQAGTSAQSAAESAAAAEVWTAHPPYIGANGNWYIYNTTTEAFVDSGIDASITVDIADITMLSSSDSPYVTNTGSNTDPIFHLFIPRGYNGVGISSITKTDSQTVSGRVVDTYTITYTDNTTTTYQVVNGKDGADGQGSGDMLKATYDPNNNQYPLNIMTGATASSAGTVGFPPPPGIGDQGKFFKGDGTWADTGSGDVSQSELAPVEATATASQAYAVDDLLVYDNTLYWVTTAIASGGTIVTTGANANVVETSISEALKKVNNRVATMPTASADYADKIVQYVGATTASYTNGYFYKCVEDSSTNPSTYSWEQTNVQPASSTQEILIAEYGVTTYSEINTAFNAGKTVIATRTYNGTTWMFLLEAKDSLDRFWFSGFGNVIDTHYAMVLESPNSWDIYSAQFALKNNPAFTGTPTAPTAAAGTNTTQIATTAFVNTAIGNATPNYSSKMVTGTVNDDTLEFTDNAITATCIIDGPYIEDALIGIDSVSQSGTTITYTLEDSSADDASAYIWVRTLIV